MPMVPSSWLPGRQSGRPPLMRARPRASAKCSQTRVGGGPPALKTSQATAQCGPSTEFSFCPNDTCMFCWQTRCRLLLSLRAAPFGNVTRGVFSSSVTSSCPLHAPCSAAWHWLLSVIGIPMTPPPMTLPHLAITPRNSSPNVCHLLDPCNVSANHAAHCGGPHPSHPWFLWTCLPCHKRTKAQSHLLGVGLAATLGRVAFHLCLANLARFLTTHTQRFAACMQVCLPLVRQCNTASKHKWSRGRCTAQGAEVQSRPCHQAVVQSGQQINKEKKGKQRGKAG